MEMPAVSDLEYDNKSPDLFLISRPGVFQSELNSIIYNIASIFKISVINRWQAILEWKYFRMIEIFCVLCISDFLLKHLTNWSSEL